TEAGGYRLRAGSLDWVVFLEALDATGRDPGDRDTGRLREALALWRGRPFSDAEDAEWLTPLRTRLEEVRLRAQVDLFEHEVGAGRATAVVAELAELAEAHPFREDLWGLYVLALYRSGR